MYIVLGGKFDWFARRVHTAHHTFVTVASTQCHLVSGKKVSISSTTFLIHWQKGNVKLIVHRNEKVIGIDQKCYQSV